jgi:hypothetical protein
MILYGLSWIDNQSSTLYSSKDDLYRSQVGRVIQFKDSVFARGTKEDSVGSRHSVYFTILTEVT